MLYTGVRAVEYKKIENITCIITISNQPDENKPKILDGFVYGIH